MNARLKWILPILAILSLLVVSCGGGEPTAQPQQQESKAEEVKEEPAKAAILIMAKYKREGICPEERKELMWMIF